MRSHPTFGWVLPFGQLRRERVSHRLIGWLTCWLCLGLSGCFGPGPDKQLAAARLHLQQGDPVAAAIEAKNLLQDHPESGSGRLVLGSSLLASGDLVGAEVELGRAKRAGVPDAELAPQLVSLWMRQGKSQLVASSYGSVALADPLQHAQLQTQVAQALADLGQTAEAEKKLLEVLAARSGFAPALTLQVRLLAQKGEATVALRQVTELLDRNPASVEAWVLRGDLLAKPGASSADLQEAVLAYRKALELNRRMPEAHGGLVTVLLRQRDTAAAQAQVATMAKAVPGAPSTLYFQSLVAYQTNDLARAREILDLLTRGASPNPQVMLLAGMTNLGLGNLDQAETQLAQASALAPQAAEPRREVAGLLLRRGKAAQALEELKPLLDVEGGDAQAQALAGQAFAQLGDFRAAEAALTRARVLRPGDAKIRVASARMQIQRGQADLGLRELQGVAEAQPDAIEADLILVAAHMQRNDRPAALQALAKAAAKQSKHPVPDFLRGKILEQSGDLAGARQAYEAALSKDSRFRQALDSLAVLDLAKADFAAARKRYEDLVKREPKSASAKLALADVSLRSGARPAAVTALIDKSVQTNPLDAGNWLAAIELQRGLGDGPALLARAQAAHAALPDEPRILRQLASVQATQGDHQQALGNLNRLVQMQAQPADLHLQLALVQGSVGNLAAARKALDLALKGAPDSFAVVEAAMALALQDQQPEQALRLARDVQARNPKGADGWLLEGDFESRRGRAEASAVAYRAALAKRESGPIAVKLHRSLLQSDPAQAERFQARWLKEHPKDGLFVVHLAEQAQRRSAWAESEARYKQALAIAPEDPLVQNNLANVLLAQDKHAEALAIAQRAVSLAPHRAELLDTLAATLARTGQWSQAIDTQQRAQELQPQDAGYRLRLAQMYLGGGKKDQARDELKKVLNQGGRTPALAEAERLMRQVGS